MKPYEGKKILDTPLVRIFQSSEYRVFITMKSGTVVEHEPFPNNLMGLVAALTLATEVCAGKFFLKEVVGDTDAPKIERQLLEQPQKHLRGDMK